MKNMKKLLSLFLALVMVCSLLPVTAHATSDEWDGTYIFHTMVDENGQYLNEDSDWVKRYQADLNSSIFHWVFYDEFIDLDDPDTWRSWDFDALEDLGYEDIDLWMWSVDMDADGVDCSSRTSTPYFYEYTNGEKSATYRLQKIEIHPGYTIKNSSDRSTTLGTSGNYTITISDLASYRDGNGYSQQPGTGAVAVVYVWERVGIGEPITPPEKAEFEVSYSYNRAESGSEPGSGQLPSGAYIKCAKGDAKDSYLPEPETKKVDSRFTIDPGSTNYSATLGEDIYDLIGWKCNDSACGNESGHPLHQIGDLVTLSANMAGQESNITFAAQWKKWDLPDMDSLGKLDLSNDPPMLILAEDRDGNSVKITQHTKNADSQVSSELELVNQEIYYEATASMDKNIASLLAGQPYLGADFAQFQIKVSLDKKLELVGVDENGMVEFTFTCPFLQPVSGKEVLVDGNVVQEVSVDSKQSPYVYKVPANALKDKDGKLLPFTFVVQWRPNGTGYTAQELAADMTLATAAAKATNKLPIKTNGSVTGWINPSAGANEARAKAIARSMLNNSPTLKSHFTNDLGLSDEQSVTMMLKYLASPIGQEASMDRTVLDANTVEAYDPCIMTFVDADGKPFEGIPNQHIKYGNSATPPTVTREGYTLTGWTLDGAAYDFTTPVTGDITLVAQWSRNNVPGPSIPPTTPPTTNIPDENPPLANVDGLNDTDHFAYIAGYPDGTVRPEANITRAEAATIFFRLMTEEYRVAHWATTNDFTDTDPGAWYNAAVSTAAKAGILKGYPDGTFKPDDPITRAEFATLAARFMTDDVTDDVGDFDDTVGHWAAKDIRRAVKAGWIKGMGGNKFEPESSITRAQVVTMVNRMLDRNLVPDAAHMLDTMKTWPDNSDTSKWHYLDIQEAGNGHEYKRGENNEETWTKLVPTDWAAKEAEWIANNGASAKTDKK